MAERAEPAHAPVDGRAPARDLEPDRAEWPGRGHGRAGATWARLRRTTDHDDCALAPGDVPPVVGTFLRRSALVHLDRLGRPSSDAPCSPRRRAADAERH